MTTARTLIKKAMQKAGILTKTETPSSDEASDALDTLNDLLASLANENLMVYYRATEQFSLVAGTATYTIGTGGTFNTSRPVSIVSAYYRIGDIDYPLTQISDENYDDYVDYKTLSSLSEVFTYDNGFPLGRMTLYPVPSGSWNIYIRMEKPLTSLTLDNDVELPPGWLQFLIYQLAVLLAPEYGVAIDPKIEQIANRSKYNVELAVAKNRSMDAVPMGFGRFNIYTGWRDRF